MAILKADTIILKRQDFRETSLIVTFFSREHGKMQGLLKGVRKDPRKFASTIEIYSRNEIVFYRSRTSTLHLVSHCDSKDYYPGIRADMSKAGTAGVMAELVHAVMAQEDRNEEVFDLLVMALKELETAPNPEKLLTLFKIKVLTLSGYEPHFDSCLSCGVRITGDTKFSLARGGLLCPRCLARDTSARSVFKGTVASMLYVQRNEFRNALTLGLNPEIKRELNLIINGFINFHLEKDLKSQRVATALGG